VKPIPFRLFLFCQFRRSSGAQPRGQSTDRLRHLRHWSTSTANLKRKQLLNDRYRGVRVNIQWLRLGFDFDSTPVRRLITRSQWRRNTSVAADPLAQQPQWPMVNCQERSGGTCPLPFSPFLHLLLLRKRVLVYFELENRTWWQHFWLFILAWNRAFWNVLYKCTE